MIKSIIIFTATTVITYLVINGLPMHQHGGELGKGMCLSGKEFMLCGTATDMKQGKLDGFYQRIVVTDGNTLSFVKGNTKQHADKAQKLYKKDGVASIEEATIQGFYFMGEGNNKCKEQGSATFYTIHADPKQEQKEESSHNNNNGNNGNNADVIHNADGNANVGKENRVEEQVDGQQMSNQSSDMKTQTKQGQEQIQKIVNQHRQVQTDAGTNMKIETQVIKQQEQHNKQAQQKSVIQQKPVVESVQQKPVVQVNRAQEQLKVTQQIKVKSESQQFEPKQQQQRQHIMHSSIQFEHQPNIETPIANNKQQQHKQQQLEKQEQQQPQQQRQPQPQPQQQAQQQIQAQQQQQQMQISSTVQSEQRNDKQQNSQNINNSNPAHEPQPIHSAQAVKQQQHGQHGQQQQHGQHTQIQLNSEVSEQGQTKQANAKIQDSTVNEDNAGDRSNIITINVVNRHEHKEEIKPEDIIIGQKQGVQQHNSIQASQQTQQQLQHQTEQMGQHLEIEQVIKQSINQHKIMHNQITDSIVQTTKQSIIPHQLSQGINIQDTQFYSDGIIINEQQKTQAQTKAQAQGQAKAQIQEKRNIQAQQTQVNTQAQAQAQAQAQVQVQAQAQVQGQAQAYSQIDKNIVQQGSVGSQQQIKVQETIQINLETIQINQDRNRQLSQASLHTDHTEQGTIRDNINIQTNTNGNLDDANTNGNLDDANTVNTDENVNTNTNNVQADDHNRINEQGSQTLHQNVQVNTIQVKQEQHHAQPLEQDTHRFDISAQIPAHNQQLSRQHNTNPQVPVPQQSADAVTQPSSHINQIGQTEIEQRAQDIQTQ